MDDDFIVDVPPERKRPGFFQRIGNAFRRDPARTEQAKANYKRRVEGFRTWQRENRERRRQRMKEDTSYYREAAQLQREKARYNTLKQRNQGSNPFMSLLGGGPAQPSRPTRQQSPAETMWGTNSMWGPPKAPVRKRPKRRRPRYVVVQEYRR